VTPLPDPGPLTLHVKKVEANGSLIIIVARDANLKRWVVQVPYRPYFYVPRAEGDKLKKRGLEHDTGPPALDGTPTYRVYVDVPASVPKRRKGFERTYEADVPYTRRFLVDSGISTGFRVKKYRLFGDSTILAQFEDLEPVDFKVKDRVMRYDIETNKPEGSKHYSPPTVAAGAVTCFTLQDTFEGTRFRTFIWHPEHGTPGRPRTEIRNKFSEGFKQDVEWHVQWYGSEEEFMVALVQHLKVHCPDMWAAWNGHHGWHRKNKGGFDAPYMINRCRRLGIAPGQLSPTGSAWAGYKHFGKETPTDKGKWMCAVDGVQLIDLMTVYQIKDGGFTASVPYSDLRRVAEDKTGIVLKKDPSAIEEWWLNNTEEFLTYSFRDVDALVGLEEEEAYCEFARDIQQFVGAEDANKLFTPMSLITTLIMRIAREEGVALPTADSDQEGHDAEGGFVLDPRIKGLQRRVGVLDLDAMYVHIIISGNLSWETWVPNPTDEEAENLICVPSDMGPQFFLKPEVRKGLLPRACEHLRALRKVYDDQIAVAQTATEIEELKKKRNPSKQLLLGVFGTSLSKFFILFRPEVGASITGTGRFLIQNLDAFVAERNLLVTYQDTDSLFIPLPEENPVEVGEALAEEINGYFATLARQMNMDHHGFNIGMEALWDPFIMGSTKKMYAGFIAWAEGKWQDPPKYSAKGIQAVKSDSTAITKEASKAVLQAILQYATPLQILDYIRHLYDGVLAGEIPLPEVVKSIGLGADPDDEQAEPNYIVNAARQGRAMYDFQYQVGQKVRILRLRGNNEVWVAVPEGEDLPEDMPVDWEHHAKAAVLRPLKPILSWIGLEDQIASIEHGSAPTKQRYL